MHITDHQKQLNMLLSALKNNRLHSSYLFTGQSGIGKKWAALYFARCLNCRNNILGELPCNECAACRKIEAGTHPDVQVISVLEDKSWISIDQLKGMTIGLQYRALDGRWNVRIIEDAHLIQSDAANSLLKILEEPPADTIIILITPSPQSLPGTILSRCITINFSILSDAVIRERLKCYSLDTRSEDIIVDLAMGSPAKALEMAGNADFLGKYSNIYGDFLNGALPGKRVKRKDAIEFLDLLAATVRKTMPALLEPVLKSKYYLRRNANVDLVFEVLRLQMKQ